MNFMKLGEAKQTDRDYIKLNDHKSPISLKNVGFSDFNVGNSRNSKPPSPLKFHASKPTTPSVS
jgi:hypothetical protein